MAQLPAPAAKLVVGRLFSLHDAIAGRI